MQRFDIPFEHQKRQQSAEEAVAQGLWEFLPAAGGWQVRTPRDTYVIRLFEDGSKTCTCLDHRRYGAFGLDCKHICGLPLWNPQEATAPASTQPTEKGVNRMTTENLVRECGWVKLFHPSSAQVTIPLSLEKPILVAEAQALMASVTSLLQAGFSVEMPCLEDGEHEEEIGFVVRRAKVNSDESETPVVDLYPVNANFRRVAKYLNEETDVREFEAACSLSLQTMPLYEGDNTIERGKNPKLDKYVVALKRPVKIVWKFNPRYEGENDKKNPKRMFVRWVNGAPAPDGNVVLSPSMWLSLEDAMAVPCPMGSKSHPEYKGMTLDQVAKTEDGRKVLEYLAGDTYRPNGDKNGQKAKAAATILLASLQPA
ncbi:MAG: hypothetical protein C3F13_02870 [Anaerolineales bacterium]|nr:MAG: hypothetical protein C3F13_02870 [Anaerolineales bacterium]